MSIRKQIIIIFLIIISVTLIAASIFHYKTAREARLKEVYNHMESISEAKKNRMIGIVQKRREQMLMMQIREGLREDYAAYVKSGDQEAYRRLLRSLELARDRIGSFRELHLVSKEGIIQVSSSPRYRGLNFSQREGFKHAMAGELCLHEFFFDQGKRLNIHLSGLIAYGAEDIGVLMIKTDAADVLTLIKDYTGLGRTGETTLARVLPSGKIYYLTPTRFHPIPGDSLLMDATQNKAMARALSGREELLTDREDYRGKGVIASPRYIPETGWGMTTKIDWEEAMAPVHEMLLETILIALILFLLAAVAGHFFARQIVKPIQLLRYASHEIAAGNLGKRISYDSKDELGELGRSFNQMAEQLSVTHQSLQEKLTELDGKNEALYRFAYVVSHDLKSPLYAISSLLALLKESLGACDEPDVQQMLRMAEGKATHMLDLINGILQYSVAGVTAEEPEEVNTNKLVSEVVMHLEVPAHVTVTVEELPVIFMERVLLIQIFQNLISNGIKYMDKPIGSVKVGFTATPKGKAFYVNDNGRGVERRHYDKIFEVFNMANRVPGVESTGLGLSIVKKIVESKGGSIWVESEVGKGSTFYFTLPLNFAGGKL